MEIMTLIQVKNESNYVDAMLVKLSSLELCAVILLSCQEVVGHNCVKRLFCR